MIDLTGSFLSAVTLLVGRTPSALDGVGVLYVGPDQIMPLTSLLGGIVGVLLMFWNRVVSVCRRIKEFRPRR